MEIDYQTHKQDLKNVLEVMNEKQLHSLFNIMQSMFVEAMFGITPPEENDDDSSTPDDNQTFVDDENSIDEIEIDSARIEIDSPKVDSEFLQDTIAFYKFKNQTKEKFKIAFQTTFKNLISELKKDSRI